MPQRIPDIIRASNTAPTSSRTPPIAMNSSLCRTITPKDAPRLFNSVTILLCGVFELTRSPRLSSFAKVFNTGVNTQWNVGANQTYSPNYLARFNRHPPRSVLSLAYKF